MEGLEDCYRRLGWIAVALPAEGCRQNAFECQMQRSIRRIASNSLRPARPCPQKTLKTPFRPPFAGSLPTIGPSRLPSVQLSRYPAIDTRVLTQFKSHARHFLKES